MYAGWTLLAAAALGQTPYGYGPQGYGPQGYGPQGYGPAAPSYGFSSPAPAPAFGPTSYGSAVPYGAAGPSGEVTASGVSGGYGDQLYPYESQEPWLHGYFQEIPAYGGYHSFKPYNYRHVLSQSQTAAGFGMSPTMPYSQQFWHRYENRANLSPFANEPGGMMPVPVGPAGMHQGTPQGTLQEAPQAFPGVGMSAPSMIAPSPVQPAAWEPGPVIVPANAESRPADGKGQWGRWSQPGEH